MIALGRLAATRRLALSGAWLDCGLLLGAVLLVTLVGGAVGLYSDDWMWLAQLALQPQRGLAEQFSGFNAAFENSRNRPLQAVQSILLYALFGVNPLAFQLFNALMLALGVILLYQTLRLLGLARALCLAVPLVYAVLPHYSSDRYWFSAYPVGTSMTLLFLSIYADLRWVRAGRGGWGWQALAVLALLGSAAAYEVAFPLFVLAPLILGHITQRLNPPLHPQRWRWVLARNTLLIAALAAAKLLTTSRGSGSGALEQLRWFGSLLGQAVTLSTLGDYGLRLPLALRQVWAEDGGHATLVLAALCGALVALALWHSQRMAEAELPGRRAALVLAACGALVFLAGYAIFLPNRQAAVSAAGLHNRTAIVAALGVALGWVAAALWLSSWLPSRRARQIGFAGALGLLCAAYIALNLSIAAHWVAAHQRQQALLAQLARDVPALPADGVLLLTGGCPYVGPAPVFEAYWDLGGALQLQRRDRTVQADVVTPQTTVSADAVVTRIYSDENRYPLARVWLYDARERALRALPDAATASAAIAAAQRAQQAACPAARPGYGAPIWQRTRP